MTVENKKENISISYLEAICASQGINMQLNRNDADGIDVLLSKWLTQNNGNKYHAKIDVQLKASSSGHTEHENYYSYPLKIKNYNDLREPATVKPYLFLLVLPENEIDWVIHSVNELVIKQCMFWLDLSSSPATSNTSSTTVHFPKAHIVSPKALEEILQTVMRSQFGEEV